MSPPSAARHTVTAYLRILHSSSRDIFWNLALEDALFSWQKKQAAMKSNRLHCLMLIYRNKPCVVIGSFQNPWLECRIRDAQLADVSVARRMSGGGAVYHDLGNWNLSLITPSDWYNREANSELMRRLCHRLAGAHKQITVGKRYDIFIDNRKVAGSAAKLAQGAAYHHFCLLVSTDLNRLSAYLGQSLSAELVTNATSSIRSPVVNLMEEPVSSERLLSAVADELANWHPTGLPPSISADSLEVGPETLDSAVLPAGCAVSAQTVQASADRLRAWDWVFGRTPKFVCRLPPPCSLAVTIEKGHITDLASDIASSTNLASQLRPFLVGQASRASALLPYLDTFRRTNLLNSSVVEQLEDFFTGFGH